MYTTTDSSLGVEAKCYEEAHIKEVLETIRYSFDIVFDRFVETEAGTILSALDISSLQNKFGSEGRKKQLGKKEKTEHYKRIIIESVDSFLKDQDKYVDIMDLDSLDEYQDDPRTFKSKVLKNECPIIRKTLNNRIAKELDKYRKSFNIADADRLLEVITNLSTFANDYSDKYDPETYEKMSSYKDLGLDVLDTEDYTVFGVIGGGIKSHMIYKLYPGLFPNRSRSAIWALWYLSDKKTFECRSDSEFLMIDPHKSITQQNYFYPYALFSYYA